MKDVIELAAFLALVGALVFIFQGDPDLWDKWHAQAMTNGCMQEKAK